MTTSYCRNCEIRKAIKALSLKQLVIYEHSLTLLLYCLCLCCCSFLWVCCLLEMRRISTGLLSVLLLEIQLSEWEGWDPIKQFNTATFLSLIQDRIWISNTTSWSFLCSMIWGERWLFIWLNCMPSLFKLSFHNFCFFYQSFK
jgi:hypothetical protein